VPSKEAPLRVTKACCRALFIGGFTESLVSAPAPKVNETTVGTGESVFEFHLSADGDKARFWVVTTPEDVPSSERFCARHGGHLAAIHSAAGLDQLRQVAARLGGYIWVGLIHNVRAQPPTYVWADQTKAEYMRWAPGQPMNLGICTLLASWSRLAGSAYYIDVPCTVRMMFACRFDS